MAHSIAARPSTSGGCVAGPQCCEGGQCGGFSSPSACCRTNCMDSAHFIQVRHHGPGCAAAGRSMRRALTRHHCSASHEPAKASIVLPPTPSRLRVVSAQLLCCGLTHLHMLLPCVCAYIDAHVHSAAGTLYRPPPNVAQTPERRQQVFPTGSLWLPWPEHTTSMTPPSRTRSGMFRSWAYVACAADTWCFLFFTGTVHTTVAAPHTHTDRKSHH